MNTSIAKALILSFLFGSATILPGAENAARTWLDKCARCHGDDGKADTSIGRKLKIRDYSSKRAQTEFSNEEAMRVILNGKRQDRKSLMPAYRDELSKTERHDLLLYLRSLAKNP